MNYDVWKLLEIAESTNAPEEQPSDSDNWCADVSFDAKDGWKVIIFYDCGDLDYISHFISPTGEVIDFWEWPESEERELLTAWRGIGDLERLRSLTKKEVKDA